MNKFKFRGKTEKGEYIFSDSIQFDSDGYGREFCCLKDEYGNWNYVEPYSVVQLVGCDAEDEEIYEGDILIDNKGCEYIATIDGNLHYCKDKNSVSLQTWRPIICAIYETGLRKKCDDD